MRERASLVSSLLENFTDRDRAFIQLYFGEGLAAELVAERLNISVKTGILEAAIKFRRGYSPYWSKRNWRRGR